MTFISIVVKQEFCVFQLPSPSGEATATPTQLPPHLVFIPKNVLDLRQRAFGQLTPLRLVEIKPGKGGMWLCACRCGQERHVPAYQLTAGRVTRCTDCARRLRAETVHRNRVQAANVRSFGEYILRWEAHLAGMTEAQRAAYDSMIAARRQRGVRITAEIKSEAVDVVYRFSTANKVA